jgi:hypothetical protein
MEWEPHRGQWKTNRTRMLDPKTTNQYKRLFYNKFDD